MTERYEGGWESKMAQFIRETGYNKDVDVTLGTVKSSPPNLRINVDGMKIDLGSNWFVVAEHVTPLSVNDRLIIISANDSQRFFVIGKVATF